MTVSSPALLPHPPPPHCLLNTAILNSFYCGVNKHIQLLFILASRSVSNSALTGCFFKVSSGFDSKTCERVTAENKRLDVFHWTVSRLHHYAKYWVCMFKSSEKNDKTSFSSTMNNVRCCIFAFLTLISAPFSGTLRHWRICQPVLWLSWTSLMPA